MHQGWAGSIEVGGDVLNDDELIAQTLLLHIAGHETTVNLIAGGALALLRHPGQLALLREKESLSPVQASRRITLEAIQTASGGRQDEGGQDSPAKSCSARTGHLATISSVAPF